MSHESKKKHLPESSTKRESRKITQQSLEQLFGTSDTKQAIKSPEESIKMAKEGGGSTRRPTPEQQHDQGEEEESTFKFPIHEPEDNPDEEIKMKNIPPSVLPNFYGMASEDPNSFLFEFDIACRTYGYTDDAYRLRLFPATSKGISTKMVHGTW